MRPKVPALLLFIGIGHLTRGAWSLSPDDRPGLPELQRFTTKDGNSLNLLQEIGIKLEGFGTCILEDVHGAKLGAIQSDHRTSESKMRDIFIKWLQGSGKRPETWATIVTCLNEVGLRYLADIIEAEYSGSGGTDDTPAKPNTIAKTGAGTSKTTNPQGQPDDEINKLNDLIQAVKDIGDWRGLCTNLGVSDGEMDVLIHSTSTVRTKMADCLKAYWNEGEAKWSDVVRAVAMSPINNKRVAKKIAKTHSLDFDEILRDEL